MTRSPMGPRWPGHSLERETNESSPGVSPVPSECGLEPKGDDRPNPVVGFLPLQAEEEVNIDVNVVISVCITNSITRNLIVSLGPEFKRARRSRQGRTAVGHHGQQRLHEPTA